MLAPKKPQQDDPEFREKMAQYRVDKKDSKTHPHNWGMVLSAEEQKPKTNKNAQGKG